MNKPSRLFLFFVAAQFCAALWVLAWLPGSHPAPEARFIAARYDISDGLKSTLNIFSQDCGRCPTTAEGFQALFTCPTNISQTLWKGPYLDQIPVDPWGHDYVYRCPGIHKLTSYDLYSTGPDGISKSGGNDPDDINNWDPNSPRGRDFSDLFAAIEGALLLIPLACGVCTISAIFSTSARAFFARNRAAFIVWVVTSVILLMMLIAPRISG